MPRQDEPEKRAFQRVERELARVRALIEDFERRGQPISLEIELALQKVEAELAVALAAKPALH